MLIIIQIVQVWMYNLEHIPYCDSVRESSNPMSTLHGPKYLAGNDTKQQLCTVLPPPQKSRG